MPIERRVILSLQPADHARFQHALLEAGLVDQLVQPILADAPVHALVIPSEDALFKLQAAMTLHGLSRPGIRRYWKPTPKELTGFDLLVMDIWLHGGGPPKLRGDRAYDFSRACPECGTGTRPLGTLLLKAREIPKRGLVSGVSGGAYLFHADLVDACHHEGMSGIEFVQAADRLGTPVPWYELRVSKVLPPMTVESTGLSRGSTSGETPCARCGRDGWFGQPEQPFTPAYQASVLRRLPDFAETYERFGQGRLGARIQDCWLAEPRLVVRQTVFELFRRRKIRGVRFTPVLVR
jgi:hypothetical protein